MHTYTPTHLPFLQLLKLVGGGVDDSCDAIFFFFWVLQLS